MWENRITLEYIKHGPARVKILTKLSERNLTDASITDLHISTEAGYVYYKVILSDKSHFTIFDDGSEI